MTQYRRGIESIFRWVYDRVERWDDRPRFEFDPEKSAANLEKHGIDFHDVQELWDDAYVMKDLDFKGERRFAAIGRITGEYWTVIATMRGDRIRLISARRSNQTERSAYDRAVNG